MRRMGKWAGLALWFALAWAFAAPAAAQTLTVEWLRVEGAQKSLPDAAPVRARWTSANPEAPAHLELPRHRGGHWLRLRVDADIVGSEQRVIGVQGARVYGLIGYYLPGSDRLTLPSLVRGNESLLLRPGWALPLPAGWKRADTAYIRMQGEIPVVLSVNLSTRAEFARQREGARRFTIAAYAALLLMTLAVAGLWAMSREAVYLYYLGYLVCISVYMLMMSNWLEVPEHWASQDVRREAIPWFMATMTTVFQIAFTVRFLDLPRLLPRAARVLHAIVWANLAWLAVLVFAYRATKHYWYLGGNGLLLLVIPTLVYAAIAAWRRGAEYAGYYLLGWTPLMVFAGLIAAKTFGFGSFGWDEHGLVLAVVLESGVLMMALTQRAAARHRRALLAKPART